MIGPADIRLAQIPVVYLPPRRRHLDRRGDRQSAARRRSSAARSCRRPARDEHVRGGASRRDDVAVTVGVRIGPRRRHDRRPGRRVRDVRGRPAVHDAGRRGPSHPSSIGEPECICRAMRRPSRSPSTSTRETARQLLQAAAAGTLGARSRGRPRHRITGPTSAPGGSRHRRDRLAAHSDHPAGDHPGSRPGHHGVRAVSSSGHLILVPWLFGWHDRRRPGAEQDLRRRVAHGNVRRRGHLLPPAISWRTSRRSFASIRRARDPTPDERLAWALVIGTIPGRRSPAPLFE